MRLIINKFTSILCRIITGCVFILSGFVKAVDPLGFAYKISEYLDNFGLDVFNKLVNAISVLLCGFELFIGICLLCGIFKKLASFLSVGFMSIFTIVTLYLVILPEGIIDDCGCFGEAIRLTNTQTFIKNIILLLLSIFYCIYVKYNSVSNTQTKNKQILLGAYIVILSITIPLYSFLYLPPFDFMPFNIGENILNNRNNSHESSGDEIKLVYRNIQTNSVKRFSVHETEWQDDKTWEYVETEVELQNKSRSELLKNFSIYNASDQDITEQIFSNNKGYVFAIVAKDIKSLDEQDYTQMNSLLKLYRANNIELYILTSSYLNDTSECLIIPAMNDVAIFNIDDTILKSMIRADKGVIVLNRGEIIGKFRMRSILNKIKISNLDSISTKYFYKQLRYFIILGLMIIILVVMIINNNRKGGESLCRN